MSVIPPATASSHSSQLKPATGVKSTSVVPDLDDLEEMPETASNVPTEVSKPIGGAIGLGGGSQFSIPTLDVGSKASNRRFASRPANNSDVSSVYKPGLR